MNAAEKIAWVHLVVSVVALATAILLIPWLGSKAVGAFGLLGLIALGVVFLRKHDNRVVVDERDREIDRTATRIGVSVAWSVLLVSLIVALEWSSYSHTNAVPTEFLTWLLWVDGAIVAGAKGLAGVVLHQRQRHAA
jgi:hypothetical protein